MYQAHVSPPRAGSSHRPQGVSLETESFTGNVRNGQWPSGLDAGRTLEVRLPKGFRINNKRFPSCSPTHLQRSGAEGCPPESVIGSGSAIIDGRPLLPNFIRTTGTVIVNSRDFSGKPIIVGWTKGLGTSVANVLWLRHGPPGFGPTFVAAPGPPTPPAPEDHSYSVTSFSVKFPDKSRLVHGRRVHLIEAPTSCHGSWLFEQVTTTYRGEKLVATDRVPCVGSSGR
jgi:hypothetical protein